MKTDHISNKQSVFTLSTWNICVSRLSSFANRFTSASRLYFLKNLYSLNVHHAGFINFNPKATSTNYYLMTVLLFPLIVFVLCYNIKKGGWRRHKAWNKTDEWNTTLKNSPWKTLLLWFTYYRENSSFGLFCVFLNPKSYTFFLS